MKFFYTTSISLTPGVLSEITLPKQSRILDVISTGYCQAQLCMLCPDACEYFHAHIYCVCDYSVLNRPGQDLGKESDMFVGTFFSEQIASYETVPTSVRTSGEMVYLPSINVNANSVPPLKYYVFVRLPNRELSDVTVESPQNVLF